MRRRKPWKAPRPPEGMMWSRFGGNGQERIKDVEWICKETFEMIDLMPADYKTDPSYYWADQVRRRKNATKTNT